MTSDAEIPPISDITPLLDEEIAILVAASAPLDVEDLATARQMRRERVAGSDAEIEPGWVELTEVHVHRSDATAALARQYTPLSGDSGRPGGALIWIHGGGHVLGHAGQDGVRLARIARTTGCSVFSADPRLSPEHPFPAEVEDSYAILRWVHVHAEELNVDPGRLVVGGASSGGGTAAGLALLARDRGEVPLSHQVLVYPMLDDRRLGRSSRAIADPRVWDVQRNDFGWRAYLGSAFGNDDVSAYAAPSRAEDLRGLPPASLFLGDRDLFLDECLEYASRLIAAGVRTGLTVYPGSPHGFDRVAPASRPARDFDEDLMRLLRRIL